MLKFFQTYPLVYVILFWLTLCFFLILALNALVVGNALAFIINMGIVFLTQWFGLKFYAKQIYDKN